MMAPVLGLLLLVLGQTEGPFADLGYDDALAQAKEQKKLLLVDFTASWCGPCKRMEKETWRSADVLAWLRQHAIAIQVDVDGQPELAKRFAIEAMPTVVALKDGQEFDRIVGYRDGATFLGWGNDVLAGKRSSEELLERAKALADSQDVDARYDLARELLQAKQYELALTHYLWLWPASREDDAMGGVRLSFMLSDMAQLAKKHEPAKKAFQELLEGMQTKLDAADVPESNDWREWARMCDYFGEPGRVIAWYERHRDDAGRLFAGRTGAATDRVVDDVFEALMKADRPRDAVRLFEDARKRARGIVLNFERMKQAGALNDDEESRKQFEDYSRRELTSDLSQLYAALLAAGRADEANDVAGTLLQTLDTPDSRIALVSAGLAVTQQAEPSFTRWLDEAQAAGRNVRILRKKLDRLAKPVGAASGDK